MSKQEGCAFYQLGAVHAAQTAQGELRGPGGTGDRALLPTVQSKITELEEKNAELTAELKRLQQENQNLDSRMGALVRLLHQRNAQLDQARSQGVSASVALVADLLTCALHMNVIPHAPSLTSAEAWWKHCTAQS